MGFRDAVRSCFAKYITVEGRALRSEYWFFVLFQILANVVANALDLMIGSHFVSILVELGLILPAIAVAVRRLHDIDKSGWWLLIGFVPLIGWIFVFIWMCTKGSLGSNRFGPDPLPAPFGAPA
jgi:uncharacterized membrane protein YhaH (DUF805 family)